MPSFLPKRRKSMASAAPETTSGTRDEFYNLVSLLYHQLQQAEHLTQYVEDAEVANDSELAEFFLEAKNAALDLSERAKALLQARLSTRATQKLHGDQLADEASKLSFPASDAP